MKSRAEYQREYKRRDPEKWKKYQREYKAAYRAEHPEYKERQYALNEKWRNENAAYLKKYSKKWRIDNKKRVYFLNRKKTFELRASVGSHTKDEWESLCIKHDGRCAMCGEKTKLTKDHIIPVANWGTNYIGNIQPLCQSCNSRKGRKFLKRERGMVWGAFDPPHHGHEALFLRAKELCEHLTVVVFDDAYIKAHKHRLAFLSKETRMELIAQSDAVDVVIFESKIRDKKFLVELHNPNILIMGSDWTPQTFKGEGLGVPVIYLPRTEGISSTQIRNQS